MEAVIVVLAASVVFLKNTLATDDTVVGMCLIIMTADWLVQIKRTPASFMLIANTGLLEL